MSIGLSVHSEDWARIRPGRITGAVFTSTPGIVIELCDGEHVGRGEAQGMFYFNETVETMTAQVEQVVDRVEAGLDRRGLLDALPFGGARHAIDAALWDLEAKRAGRRAWELAGLELKTITTVMTVGLEDTPAAMAAKAAAARSNPVLKVKLNDDRPVERIEAIRRARPDARLVVDVNQGWGFSMLQEVAPCMARLGVKMIEQPLPRGADAELEGFVSPVPLCADESCLQIGELDDAARRYRMINIKLDKCGGLTAGLDLARAVRSRGLGVMVGCMGGTSLAMAPGFVVGLLCDFHDLDGPLMLKHDRPHALSYHNGVVEPPSPQLWG